MTTHAKLDAAHAELGAALEQAAAAVCRAEAEREAFCSSAPLAEWMADPVARRVMIRQALGFEFDVAAGASKDLLSFFSREWLIDRAETLIGDRDITSTFDLAVAALQAMCAAKWTGARPASSYHRAPRRESQAARTDRATREAIDRYGGAELNDEIPFS